MANGTRLKTSSRRAMRASNVGSEEFQNKSWTFETSLNVVNVKFMKVISLKLSEGW